MRFNEFQKKLLTSKVIPSQAEELTDAQLIHYIGQGLQFLALLAERRGLDLDMIAQYQLDRYLPLKVKAPQ